MNVPIMIKSSIKEQSTWIDIWLYRPAILLIFIKSKNISIYSTNVNIGYLIKYNININTRIEHMFFYIINLFN